MRSYKKELLDRDDIPFEHIKQNMKELDFINKYLGGHRITMMGAKKFLERLTEKKQRHISICEIGCGGGDNLRVIKKYCQKKQLHVSLSGVDINPHCIEFARSRKENEAIVFFTSDYRLTAFGEKPDILFCSLFTHHFTDDEIIAMLRWMKENSNLGFFINDLHRHPFAYYSIKCLTWLFSRSYLVKNDASLSVQRGFKRKDWELYCTRSGIAANQKASVHLQWKWAFRWLLIYLND